MNEALIINCSKGYNLGARKLTDWLQGQGYIPYYYNGDPGLFAPPADLVCLSVIFSWDAPLALEIAMRYKDRADIWVGGPGMFALWKWWKDRTGSNCVRGLDQRFDHQCGNYFMTFASRGCPVGCYFCIVPKIEGTDFTLNWDFCPAPILCDNNLSALPIDFQEHIIRRYQETGTKLVDANSGFEPRTFDDGTYQRWKHILRGPWRFAYDDLPETEFVQRMMAILKDEPKRSKQVYCLIGNEPYEACLERLMKIIEWGGEPYCQPLMPLNALSRDHLTVRHDWTKRKLKDFARYANRHLWRYIPIQEYQPSPNSGKPFADGVVMHTNWKG